MIPREEAAIRSRSREGKSSAFVSICTDTEINGNVKPRALSIVGRIFVTILRNVADDNFGTGCFGGAVQFPASTAARSSRRGPGMSDANNG